MTEAECETTPLEYGVHTLPVCHSDQDVLWLWAWGGCGAKAETGAGDTQTAPISQSPQVSFLFSPGHLFAL